MAQRDVELFILLDYTRCPSAAGNVRGTPRDKPSHFARLFSARLVFDLVGLFSPDKSEKIGRKENHLQIRKHIYRVKISRAKLALNWKNVESTSAIIFEWKERSCLRALSFPLSAIRATEMKRGFVARDLYSPRSFRRIPFSHYFHTARDAGGAFPFLNPISSMQN